MSQLELDRRAELSLGDCADVGCGEPQRGVELWIERVVGRVDLLGGDEQRVGHAFRAVELDAHLEERGVALRANPLDDRRDALGELGRRRGRVTQAIHELLAARRHPM